MKEGKVISVAPKNAVQTNSPSLITRCNVLVDTKTTSLASRFMTSQSRSPLVETMQDPQEAWLPLTESRAGNAFSATCHSLCSAIGIQALLLPLAFTNLGWAWGIICLVLAFTWQLYSLWLLIQLHESSSGMRYSRYLHLSVAAFGEKAGKVMTLFPIMYLSSGTCVTLIMIGGGTMETLFELLCDNTCNIKPLTTIEWYLLFASIATLLAQLPNLNSIAAVSLVGAISSASYCTAISFVSVTKGRPSGVFHEPLQGISGITKLFEILNSLGMVAFAFRGHNLVLEIQGTMPSSVKCPSSLPMWRGVKIAYTIIAMCLLPVSICGYWAYGNLMPNSYQGALTAIYEFHKRDASKFVTGAISVLVVISCLSSFQIYAMPAFDNLESKYTGAANRACPLWLRIALRVFFGCLASFIAIALPFLPSLAGVIGGLSLPLTLAYPSFMWIIFNKPRKLSSSWLLNWCLGSLGMILSAFVVTAAIQILVTKGLQANFLNP